MLTHTFDETTCISFLPTLHPVFQVASTAATNLSFLYFLQGENDQAEKYAELARETDSYNAAAFVNLGNCCLSKGDIEKVSGLLFPAITEIGTVQTQNVR